MLFPLGLSTLLFSQRRSLSAFTSSNNWACFTSQRSFYGERVNLFPSSTPRAVTQLENLINGLFLEAWKWFLAVGVFDDQKRRQMISLMRLYTFRAANARKNGKWKKKSHEKYHHTIKINKRNCRDVIIACGRWDEPSGERRSEEKYQQIKCLR